MRAACRVGAGAGRRSRLYGERHFGYATVRYRGFVLMIELVDVARVRADREPPGLDSNQYAAMVRADAVRVQRYR